MKPTENKPGRLLVAGIGNIFFGDDAFGVEVVRALSRIPLPEQVRVLDFGIRSYDLAYALTEGYDAAILVDALPRGSTPGTTFLIEPDLDALSPPTAESGDPHTMNPVAVLQLARTFGALPPRLFVVGCEPAVLENDTGEIGLSPSVRAAVPLAIGMIESLIGDLLGLKLETDAGLVPG